MNTKIFVVVSVVISTLVGIGIYFTVSSADATVKTKAPKTLVGTWHQTNKVDGIIMQASVNSDDTIQVNLKTRDSSSIYWMGSFDSQRDPQSSFDVHSQANSDALEMSIFGSQDPTKTFKYNRGDLSFKFTMMGTTSTIHLQK